MAVYKVIQDVEAEDKLLGPLTLKAFIYAAIAAFCAFIEYKLIQIGTPIKFVFILMFLVPMVLFGVLASPLGRDQPTEVWLLSKIRFFLKPRRRIWDQEGQLDLVTVTAPKKVETQLTKDLTQNEVQSRLKTLASTLDTRGWAIKNIDVNLPDESTAAAVIRPSDRLVGGDMPNQVSDVVVGAADDILDEKSNPTAQKFEAMMQRAAAERKHGILSALRGLHRHHGDEDDVMSDSARAAMTSVQRRNAAARARRQAEKESELEDKLAQARLKFTSDFTAKTKPKTARRKAGRAHSAAKAAAPKAPAAPAPPAAAAASPMTSQRQAVNMELAQSGSAFSVATLSKLANRQPSVQQTGPNEITISLH